MSWIYEFLAGAGVGLIGGLTSGFMGTSPGGGLVIFCVLLLGAEQHIAQGRGFDHQNASGIGGNHRRALQPGSDRRESLKARGFPIETGDHFFLGVTRPMFAWRYIRILLPKFS